MSEETLTRYRADVWRAVGMLWIGFGDRAEAMISPAFPQALEHIDDCASTSRTPEAAALEIVTQVVGAYARQKMSPEERAAVLGELLQLTKMEFEEAEGHMALPFVHHTVQACLVIRDWAAAGRVDRGASSDLLRGFIQALAGKP